MSETVVDRLRPEDRPRWSELWTAYLEFYETVLPQNVHDATWARLMDPEASIHGFGLRVAKRLVGIVHYIPHDTCWGVAKTCYLQDLFVDPAQRGRGGARRLIEAVGAEARRQGWRNVYWLTQESNATARALYDKVARLSEFVRYDMAP